MAIYSTKTYNKRRKKSSFLGGLFSFVSNMIKIEPTTDEKKRIEKIQTRAYNTIEQSDYISRDLSWLKFDERVLDQARNENRSLFDRLKFLAITASNLDEFFTIRVGSLYNYLDYTRERIDYSGLREIPFKKALFGATQKFYRELNDYFIDVLLPLFPQNGCQLITMNELWDEQEKEVTEYFDRTLYPMLTPMAHDVTHTFPTIVGKTLTFGVITKNAEVTGDGETKKLSFVQIPQNLPRFYVLEEDADNISFLPIEEIIRANIEKLYRNVEILSVHLFRITRNGDFDLAEHEDTEMDFLDEVKQKIKDRRLGRVTRLEIETDASEWMIELLKVRWDLEDNNIFEVESLMDLTSLWQIVKHPDFKEKLAVQHPSVLPLGLDSSRVSDVFQAIRQGDILLHHPYNSFEPVIRLLEQAATDPQVLSIKITLYRISKNSRIANALLKAAENNKHVSVLFEVKARFDEENNIKQAQRLAKAGVFVIYGIPKVKTHTKLLQVTRQEEDRVRSYAHLSSGNYNEDTVKLYTDVGLLTCDDAYTRDIAEFFNVITGHSIPERYQNLITAPRHMRDQLIELIKQEYRNAKAGLPAAIILKTNSLQDKDIIDELYKASQKGVRVKLIIRGVCCLRPQRKGLSDNITVRSIVGDFLEHTRLYYFHNNGDPQIYGGSADIMVRSFDRRIESLFLMVNHKVRQQAILILDYNLKDNVNSYEMQEDGSYVRCEVAEGEPLMNIHQRFFEITEEEIDKANVYDNQKENALSNQ
jgi:polyphosphate kinase